MTDARDTHHTDDHDGWLQAINSLAPQTRNARTFPPESPLVHMTGHGGDLVLRQWPGGPPARRIAWLADALDAAHAHTGDMLPVIEPVPNGGARSVLDDGRLYTRSPYLRGRALGRYSGYAAPDGSPITVPLHESAAAHSVVAEATRVIAQVHLATGDIAARKDAPAAPLSEMLEAVRRMWLEEKKNLGMHAAGQRDIRRWLRCGNRVIPTASDLLRNEEAVLHERSVLTHGTLWPENVLIEGREDDRHVTGIVGWTHAAAGSPVMDLAALAVHMQGWSAAMTEAIVETYSQVAPLRPDQRRLVPVVAALDLVMEVGRMLRLNYLDEGMIRHPAQPLVRSAMKTLLNSLETLTQILAPDIEQTSRFQRRGGVPNDAPPRRGRPFAARGRQRQDRPPRSKDGR